MCQNIFANSKLRSLSKYWETESAWISFPSVIRQISDELDDRNNVAQRGGKLKRQKAKKISFSALVFLLLLLFDATWLHFT